MGIIWADQGQLNGDTGGKDRDDSVIVQIIVVLKFSPSRNELCYQGYGLTNVG